MPSRPWCDEMRRPLAKSRPVADIPATDRVVTKSDNRPPLISDFDLCLDHEAFFDRIEDAEKLLVGMPARIDDDETNGLWQDHIPAIATLLKDIEAERVAVKAPFLTANSVIDAFFKQTLAARAEKVHASISALVGNYLQRKRDAERARREAEAKRLRDEQARQVAEAARLRAEAAAAEAAERAKIQAEANEAKRAAAEAAAAAHTAEAEQKAREAEMAAARAGAGAVAAGQSVQAKSADMARTRSAGGSLGTLVDSWNFQIDDIDAIKGSPLWPYVDRASKEKAIRAYMKVNAPKTLAPDQKWQPLEGITFFRETTSQVRG